MCLVIDIFLRVISIILYFLSIKKTTGQLFFLFLGNSSVTIVKNMLHIRRYSGVLSNSVVNMTYYSWLTMITDSTVAACHCHLVVET